MRIDRALRRFATAGTIIGLVAALVVIQGVFVWGLMPRFTDATGGQLPLDSRYSYTADEAYGVLDAAGPGGRRILGFFAALDMVYPIVYSLAAAVLVIFLVDRLAGPDHALQRLAMLPFLVAALDYCENASIVTLMVVYPDRLPAVAKIASSFTSTKWTFAAAGGVILIGLLIALGIKRLRRA